MYLDINTIPAPVSRFGLSEFYLSETLLEKGSGQTNDDVLSTDNEIYIVCDGATSLEKKDSSDSLPVSGGQQAARIAAEVFSQNGAPLLSLAEQANDRIHQAMVDAEVDFAVRENLWTTSVAAARIKNNRLEWIQAGDCMVLLLYQDGSSRLVTKQTGQDTETLKKWKRIGGNEDGTIHQVLANEIAAVRKDMNRTYGVLNGEPEALRFLTSGIESLECVDAVLLFSDGLWLPSEFPEKGLDYIGLAELYRTRGLRGIRNTIRAVQKDDPRCCVYPRFKMHDDISAIALRRTGE